MNKPVPPLDDVAASRFEDAVRANDLEQVRAYLHRRPELGFDPDEPIRKSDGEYVRCGPIMECARTGQPEMAETLLRHGASLTPAVAVLLGKTDWLREQRAAGKLQIDWPRNDPSWFQVLIGPQPGDDCRRSFGPFERWPAEDRERFTSCFRLILERCDPNMRVEGRVVLHEIR